MARWAPGRTVRWYMRLLGFSFGEFTKIGLAAVVFILAIKWLAPKTGVPALTATVNRV